MKRRMVLATALCALLVAGCVASSFAVETARAADGAARAAQPGEKWYSFQVAAGGAVLELPCSVESLTGRGWRLAAGADETLRPGEYAEVTVHLSDGALPVWVGNTGDAPARLDACRVVGLCLTGAQGEAAVTLPGGVAPGSPRARVLEAWGEPDAQGDPGAARLRYSTGRNAYIELAFEEERVADVQLVRWEAPAPLPESLPPEVLAYRPPAALGQQVWSYNIRYDGDLYTLPAPVAAFLENGWLLRDTAEVEPGGFLMGVTLCRGNQRLRTRVMNFSGTAQPLAGCFVVMAESSPTGIRVPLELPGGLSGEASYEEALALLGAPDEIYRDMMVYVDRTALTYYGADGKLVLRFAGDELALYDLEVWHTAL